MNQLNYIYIVNILYSVKRSTYFIILFVIQHIILEVIFHKNNQIEL